MRQAGWIEGKTIQIEYRCGAGDPAKIQTAAAELVQLAPDLIYVVTLKAVQAVIQKTITVLVADPVGMGVVNNLSHPGGNVTGFDVWDPGVSGKLLQTRLAAYCCDLAQGSAGLVAGKAGFQGQ
jgi:putative tryptophan/tyrosine transport system substrate-binding protein